MVERGAFYVLEKVETFTTLNGENLRKIPEFWTRANADGTVETLLKNGHTVSEIKKNKVGLEEYYIELMSRKEAE